MPRVDHDPLAVLGQHLHELGGGRRLGDPRRLPDHHVQLGRRLQPAPGFDSPCAQNDAGQLRRRVLDPVDRRGVGVHGERHLRERGEFPAHLRARPPQHHTLGPQVARQGGGGLDRGLLAAEGAPAPFRAELLHRPEHPRPQRLEHVVELAPVVVDRGGRQAEPERRVADDGQRGVVLVRTGMTQFLHLVEHHAAGERREVRAPAHQFVVVEQVDVGAPEWRAAVPAVDLGPDVAGLRHQDVEPGGEPADLLPPLAGQVGHRDDDRRPRPGVRDHPDGAGRFAESDVVGQEERAGPQDEGDGGLLVGPQRHGQVGRRRDRPAAQDRRDERLPVPVLPRPVLQVGEGVDLHREAVEEPDQFAGDLGGVGQEERVRGPPVEPGERPLQPHRDVGLADDHPAAGAPGALRRRFQGDGAERPAHNPLRIRWENIGFPSMDVGRSTCFDRVVTTRTAPTRSDAA